MPGPGSLFREEEHRYVPFVAAAVTIGLVVGFPLGLLLAHAAAQGSSLDGRWPAVAQAHGHLQLAGWLGLFVMGMAFRLVPRFTGVSVRPAALVPLTWGLMLSGLALRAAVQPFGEAGVPAGLFVTSAALEAAGTALFAAAVLRCLAGGRAEGFLYTPFFAAGAVWALVAAGLNLAFVADAVREGLRTVSPGRSLAVTAVELYGFVTMFILAVSLRTFPVFFERAPAPRLPALAAWGVANAALAAYAAAAVLPSYRASADVRAPEAAAFLSLGAALVALVLLLRILEGRPHRLRASARRSMLFVRSAYLWLLAAAGLQLFFAARALLEERLPAYYETDAVRHLLALGFATTMIIGMAFLVLPPLAMRRAQARAGRVAAPLLLALLFGATAARATGSLLVNEGRLDEGFWTMSGAGTAGVLLMLVFAGYLLWRPRPAQVPLAVREG